MPPDVPLADGAVKPAPDFASMMGQMESQAIQKQKQQEEEEFQYDPEEEEDPYASQA